MANIEPEEDLTNVSSIDHQWLQFVGLVTKENALDYFANSPFYERTCNNEGNNIYIIYHGNILLYSGTRRSGSELFKFFISCAKAPYSL